MCEFSLMKLRRVRNTTFLYTIFFFIEIKSSSELWSLSPWVERNNRHYWESRTTSPSSVSFLTLPQCEVLYSSLVFSDRLCILHSSVSAAHCWYDHCPCLQELLRQVLQGFCACLEYRLPCLCPPGSHALEGPMSAGLLWKNRLPTQLATCGAAHCLPLQSWGIFFSALHHIFTYLPSSESHLLSPSLAYLPQSTLAYEF